MRLSTLIIAFLSILCLTASSGYSEDSVCPATGLELHSSLCEIHIPVLQWVTENFIVRVDDMGRSKYRYVAWDSDEDQSDEPSLVLTNGMLVLDGTGGNHHYEFHNDIYTYECYVEMIGLCEYPGYLKVYRDDEQILSEPVLEVIYNAN